MSDRDQEAWEVVDVGYATLTPRLKTAFKMLRDVSTKDGAIFSTELTRISKDIEKFYSASKRIAEAGNYNLNSISMLQQDNVSAHRLRQKYIESYSRFLVKLNTQNFPGITQSSPARNLEALLNLLEKDLSHLIYLVQNFFEPRLPFELEGQKIRYPYIPPQILAPLSVTVLNNKYTSLETGGHANISDSIRDAHSFMVDECSNILGELGGNSPKLKKRFEQYKETLGSSVENLNIVRLGCLGISLRHVFDSARNELIGETSGLLNGFVINHEIFIQKFKKWQEYIAATDIQSIAIIDDTATAPAAYLSERIGTRSEMFDQNIITSFRELSELVESSTPAQSSTKRVVNYGLMSALNNLLSKMGEHIVLNMRALGDAIKKTAINKIADVLVKNSIEFLAASRGPLEALAKEFDSLFGWIKSLLDYISGP
jgi:hypothetical protein